MNREDTVRTLNDIHAVQLEMLKTLDAVFDRHGLRYSLYCGTLLGAIRHKGFIPWDDDVDLVMPLTDYRRFLRIAQKELPAGYVVLSPETSRRTNVPWIKVCLDGTTMLRRSQAAYDTHWGLFIDIYPMLGEPRRDWMKKLQPRSIEYARRILFQDYYRAMETEKKTGATFKQRLVRMIPGPVRRLAMLAALRLGMRPTENSLRVGSIDAAKFMCKFDRSWWDGMIKVPFEDAAFAVPAQYDRILTLIYGDYMTPPPESKRYGHGCSADDMIYDTHRDYREYRKELLGI